MKQNKISWYRPKLGSDPELEIIINDKHMHADQLLLGGMRSSFGVDGHSAICELRPEASSSILEVVNNMRIILKHGHAYLKTIMGKESKVEFFTQSNNKALGGHIHVDYKGGSNFRRLDSVMDNILGLPERMLNHEYNIKKRGSYSSFNNYKRTRYGIEYRTCSANIINNKYIYETFLGMAKIISVLVLNKNINKNNKMINDDKSLNLFEFHNYMKSIKKKIDESDTFYLKIIDAYTEIISSGSFVKDYKIDLPFGWNIHDEELDNMNVIVGMNSIYNNKTNFCYALAELIEKDINDTGLLKENEKIILFHGDESVKLKDIKNLSYDYKIYDIYISDDDESLQIYKDTNAKFINFNEKIYNYVDDKISEVITNDEFKLL